jgi:hypothetical protein
MGEITAYECEECGTLGRASDLGVNGVAPPEGWLYVSTQIINGDDPEPAKLFCTTKCRGLHFRPIQRRKGTNGDDDQEGDQTA